ncbi:MAG: sulfatase-like hydrolase/transferase [Marinilabiliaceae bacterium]|nr:sulfatase-like hydrolase/transferase [Marinilabiliaceae bacterium]
MNKYLIRYLLALLLVVFPVLIAACYSHDTIVATMVKKIFYVLYGVSFMMIPAMIIKPRYFLVIMLPFVLIATLDVYVVKSLGSMVTDSVVASIYSTNFSEAKELILSNLGYVSIFIVLVVGYFILIKSIPIDYVIPKRLKWAAVCFFVVVQMAVLSRDLLMTQKVLPEDRMATMKYYSSVKLRKVFPVNWLIFSLEYFDHRQRVDDYSRIIKDFKFGAIDADTVMTSNKPKLAVVVIGESARSQNFSLYGYDRPTNPMLSLESNLILMKQAETVFNVTSKSFPVMMSRAKSDCVDLSLQEPSLLQAFKEAGYKTYYINNQPLNYGSIYYQYAHQADSLIDLKPQLDLNCSDEVVLPVFENIVKSSASDRKVLVVIHTMGSHFRYNLRYPQSFRVFNPSMETNFEMMSLTADQREVLINSYDNSILYTDFVLSRLIQRLKQQVDSESYLIYSSDHGENIFDDSNEVFGHGGSNMSDYERMIPMMVWVSDSYRDKHPKRVAVLESNANVPVTTEHFFHTVLDLGSIFINQETHKMSFANENFNNRRNLVKNSN